MVAQGRHAIAPGTCGRLAVRRRGVARGGDGRSRRPSIAGGSPRCSTSSARTCGPRRRPRPRARPTSTRSPRSARRRTSTARSRSKPTQLGLDMSVEECLANVEPIVEEAARSGTVVMFDMESVGYVEPTLRVFREAHARYPKVGVALQSYLRRTERDLETLPPGSRIRLVKGAYLEPPEVVYTSKREVDASYRAAVHDVVRARALDRCGDARPAAPRGRAPAGGRGRRGLVPGGVPDAVRCPPRPAGRGSPGRDTPSACTSRTARSGTPT